MAASPNTGVNTLTGEGLAGALANTTVVIDVSNSPSFEDAAALEFFETSTRNLLAAETAAGVGHHVALSVVGTGAVAAERLLPGEKCPGEADRKLGDPVFDPPSAEVPESVITAGHLPNGPGPGTETEGW